MYLLRVLHLGNEAEPLAKKRKSSFPVYESEKQSRSNMSQEGDLVYFHVLTLDNWREDHKTSDDSSTKTSSTVLNNNDFTAASLVLDEGFEMG